MQTYYLFSNSMNNSSANYLFSIFVVKLMYKNYWRNSPAMIGFL